MKKIVWLLSLICLTPLTSTGAEPEFQQTGKIMAMSFPTKDWHGKHQFQKVYCATFPTPEKAQELQSAMFNQNAINLSSVDYDGFIRAAIAVSTIPENRTVEEELLRLSNNEKNFIAKSGLNTHMTEFTTLFGPTIGLRINNMAPGSAQGPFPLARAIFSSPENNIQSMSVHRLFARGRDRFEIALLQYVPDGVNPEKQQAMEKHLTALADNLTNSLQECTIQLLK
ncbi:MAG: hypothetical protein CVU29_02645 [Betaproteobacteria bacterium HGW-Betaproteobacteria-22]|nr:MAG: hypothetical protein CVU29_02645 [Betaproteobacteria bacterium HGW-Betaproteobacteria-22]